MGVVGDGGGETWLGYEHPDDKTTFGEHIVEQMEVLRLPRIGESAASFDDDAVGTASWVDRTAADHAKTTVNNALAVVEDLGMAAAAPFMGIALGVRAARASWTWQKNPNTLWAAGFFTTAAVVGATTGIVTGLGKALGNAGQAGLGLIGPIVAPVLRAVGSAMSPVLTFLGLEPGKPD